ncbi:MAG TPA: sulfite exporter TauE/SafE family protein [Dehalococcoidales bacterium]|nr:sulfite exporter TauE/SafE family protein [Dehalococcoidales bacterium]
MIWLLLAAIGLAVGAFSTLIGAGGGFLLVPILLFLYPQESPSTITSITLTVAFLNALSGSAAYSRLKRIDYRSGLLFSIASAPGAVIGATINTMLSRNVFQVVFGTCLIIVATYLVIRPERLKTGPVISAGRTARNITDSNGNAFSYSFSLPIGMAIAFVVGLISGLLGIGGGIMEVPALTQFLAFPAHIATATSQFLVTMTSFAAVIAHVISGHFTEGFRRATVLSVGAIIGAQFGARLSHDVSGALIVRLLAGALALVAVRLLIAAF